MSASSPPSRAAWLWVLLPSAALIALVIVITLLTQNRPVQDIPAATPTPSPAAAATPTPALQPTPTAVKINYIVMPGDTLASISAYFNVSPEAIMQVNNLSSADEIYFGQSLVIPVQAVTPAP